jgi:hypothetical protein
VKREKQSGRGDRGEETERETEGKTEEGREIEKEREINHLYI